MRDDQANAVRKSGKDLLFSGEDASLMNEIKTQIIRKLNVLIESVRSENKDIVLVLVGGGAKLIPPDVKLPGIAKV